MFTELHTSWSAPRTWGRSRNPNARRRFARFTTWTVPQPGVRTPCGSRPGCGGTVASGDVSTAPARVYVARLVGLPIFDPQGDQVGKVRDLVVAVRSEVHQPRVLGMVAEVFGRRRIFVPMTRVTNIDSGQVYTTGLLNMRRFEQRPTETLVIGQMLDRTVRDPEQRRQRHGLRRRDGAGPQPRLGALPGRHPGAHQGPAPARPDPRRRVARRRGADRPRGVAGRDPPDRRAQRDAPRRRRQHAPRPAARASYGRGRRPRRRAPRRRPGGAARRRTRSRSSSSWTPSGPPTSSRRCRPTTPPT